MAGFDEICSNEILPLPASSLNNPAIQEILRDGYYAELYGTVAHEIGHSPGRLGGNGDHDELGLMRDGGAKIDVPFSPGTINRFRDAEAWRD